MKPITTFSLEAEQTMYQTHFQGRYRPRYLIKDTHENNETLVKEFYTTAPLSSPDSKKSAYIAEGEIFV